jgi:hypothetical protein
MHRYITLNGSLLVALPLAALMMTACGGQASDGSSSTQDQAAAEPNSDPNAPLATKATNLEEGETPVDVVDDNSSDRVVDGPNEINHDGSPIAESGKAEASGVREGTGPDFEPDPNDAPPTAEQADTGEGVAQANQALLSDRRIALFNEIKREYGWLNKSTSYYSHTTYMNESTGTRRTDCSGYIGYALRRVLRSAYDIINNATYGTSVKSEDYVDYFMNRPTTASTNTSSARWRKIKLIRDLKPGDVLVWRNPSWMENTGHTMVVRDYPRAGRTSKNEILVPIYDSTNKPHSYGGVWDSRGTTRTGVGAGTIGIKVNSNGEGVAYYWSGGTAGVVTYRTVIAGRIE